MRRGGRVSGGVGESWGGDWVMGNGSLERVRLWGVASGELVCAVGGTGVDGYSKWDGGSGARWGSESALAMLMGAIVARVGGGEVRKMEGLRQPMSIRDGGVPRSSHPRRDWWKEYTMVWVMQWRGIWSGRRLPKTRWRMVTMA